MTKLTEYLRRPFNQIDSVAFVLVLTLGIALGPVVVVDVLAAYADLASAVEGPTQ